MDPGTDRILVVEDDDDAREAIADLLRRHGYVVDTAADGAQAASKVEREPPDLVLSDVWMPNGGGFELVRALRARPASAHIPIILISALDEQARRVAGLDLGADDYLPKPVGSAELLARVRVHLKHAHRQRELERHALLDPLTSVLNRRGAVAALSRHHERSVRHRSPLSVLVIDIDRFKEINDTHGHAAGDAVLCHLARLLTDAVRVVDHVGRLGGDEFIVILSDTDASAAGALCARLRAMAIPPALVDGHELTYAISIGAATLRDDETIDELLARADRAMYGVKRGAARALHVRGSGTTP